MYLSLFNRQASGIFLAAECVCVCAAADGPLNVRMCASPEHPLCHPDRGPSSLGQHRRCLSLSLSLSLTIQQKGDGEDYHLIAI